MTYGAFTQEFEPYHLVRRGRTLDPRMGLCVIALAVTTSVGTWALYPNATPLEPQVASSVPAPTPTVPVVQKTAAVVATPKDAPKTVVVASKQQATPERGLLDPELTSSYAAIVFARNAPLRSNLAGQARSEPITPAPVQVATAPQIVPEQVPVSPILVETPPPHVAPLVADAPSVPPRLEDAAQTETPVIADVPLPQPRPANLGVAKTAPARVAFGDRDIGGQGAQATPSAAAEPGQPSFFDKLFGRPKETGAVLAYASPEDGVIGNVLRNTVTRPQAAPDRYTAVYNITTHTVTLPDGSQLEAHSGLGAAKDNPRSVAMRMVGATPPNLYDLTVREAPFHGVRALRLTPTGGTTYGRAGLLAHTYMLRGHSGESNGCVVFRDYEAFLRAYETGTIRRLAVVAGV